MGPSWDQVGTKLGLSRDQVEKLLSCAIQAVSAADLRMAMKMTNATKFKRNYIDPLLELKILAMTQPNSPKSPTQKYYLTEMGKALLNKEPSVKWHIKWHGPISMDQESRWLIRYQEVKTFIEENHRNPSKHRLEEHDMLNWLKANRKAMNKGVLKPERVEALKELLALTEQYRRVNQWA